MLETTVSTSSTTARAGLEVALPARPHAPAVIRSLVAPAFLALCVGLALQLAHAGQHEAAEPPPLVHWLRDAALMLPLAWAALATVPWVNRRAATWARLDVRDPVAVAVAAAVAGLLFAAGSVPGSAAHSGLFGAHHEGMGFVRHALFESQLVFGVAFTAIIALAILSGVVASGPRAVGARSRRRRAALMGAVLAPGLALGGLALFAAGGDAAAPVDCARTVTADVVALDQRIEYNRLGVVNPFGMIYALRRDVVPKSGSGPLAPGEVKLRPGKRPRPLTLRANVGDCLRIHFTNLLAPARIDAEQPVDRHAGIHVNGMVLVGDGTDAIASDGSNVGQNASSLAQPGESRDYTLLAEHENTYLLSNPAVTVGSEAGGGTIPFGLFGAVNVEPTGTEWYRSQVTRDEMDAASTRKATDDAPPILDYEAQADGVPILNMLTGSAGDSTREIVHSDLNAIISGRAADGYKIPKADYPASYWANQVYNMHESRGQEPFREFTVIFHDEIVARQAFDLFKDPKFRKTLAGVKDGFAINYGTGGIGAEILANRVGVGPSKNCTECKAEEFFLTSWVVGDPAMVVDHPSMIPDANGKKMVVNPLPATRAEYPEDPSNVHHSYLNDRVKFRNLHAGPKEHHIFHLHTHQWLFTPNSNKSGYLDSQLVGPGSGYTYEIAFGGSGNRNKVIGDAIFHCHFYPHFAQGMWEFWRTHDTFERGTLLDGQGRPVPTSAANPNGARANPDGEIQAGTPIPALIPLPSRPMAPMPDAKTKVVPYDLDGDGQADSSQIDSDGDDVADVAEDFKNAPQTNPGFPFMIPGVAGHRPPTPALDMVDANGDGQVEDGGLSRHVIVGGTARHFETTLDFNKTLETAKVAYVPEDGTATEKLAMAFHSRLWHPTALPSGDPVPGDNAVTADGRPLKGFETNGLPAVQGAPFSEPCRSDSTPGADTVTRAGDLRPNPYKGAVLQTDATLNKAGWHFQQQRFETLWDDVGPTLTRKRAPEPLVMRLDAGDCVDFWHTNLVPNVYELDDYQVRTPTDVIGQHIHLVKFDVTAADGSGNGFNYEDGSFSPQEVTERIHAVRAENKCGTSGDANGNGREDAGDTPTSGCPLARAHPFFKNVAGVGDLAWGARTTMQRWYADPILNDAWDQGHGAVFTHDHFGPSTHQQVGLYSTVLVEPGASKWRDPETGVLMGSRDDGGPTSWKADVFWGNGDPNDVRNEHAHREFYFEFADFQHAYQAASPRVPHTQDNREPDDAKCGGTGRPLCQIASYADFKNAINPSFRQQPPAGREADLYFHPPVCDNGEPRPCPEAISADDVGTFVVNHRNEPLGLRVFNPKTGKQATGAAGDLSLAFQSRTDRALTALNSQPAVYPPLTKDVGPGDPWTPMMRAYMGDKIRIRAQVGATEEEHNLTIHGLKWRQEELLPDSGWRNTQAGGISEYFNLQLPVLPDLGPGSPASQDYLYEMGAATDDLWNGIWGLLRSYGKQRTDLLRLPNNQIPAAGWTITNQSNVTFGCPTAGPTKAPFRDYNVTAVRAADVLPNGRLVYNDRKTAVTNNVGIVQGSGPLVDPTAIMYVNTADLVLDAKGKPVGLKPGTAREPLVLRAAAGDCLRLRLRNALPSTVPDMPGFNALPAIVHKDEGVNGGIVTFNDNDVTPSSLVGLHPQLVHFDVRKSDGSAVGGTGSSLVAPGQEQTYFWYAGDATTARDGAGLKIVTRPVEFGASNLMPADPIKGGEKGAIGALVVEPPGATWQTDPGRNTSATVTLPDTTTFREFVPVLQTDVNLRYGGRCSPTTANLQCAVSGLGAEGVRGPAEDAEDGGHKAINYGAEPLWFRLGLDPTVPFTGSDSRLLNHVDAHKVYSNSIVAAADLPAGRTEDPQTAVFRAKPGDEVRIRVVEPAGHSRGAVIAVHGHAWQREPYVQDSDKIAVSDTSQWVGSQEGIAPSSHFDFLIPHAGGSSDSKHYATGDFLFRDQASFGNYQGLWGILRVQP